MADTAPKNRRSAKSSLAASVATATKNILGAVVDKPRSIELPQAVSEIHVSPTDVIPAGIVITRAIAVAAGLDVDDIEDLIDSGHVKLVEVYAMADTDDDDAMSASQG